MVNNENDPSLNGEESNFDMEKLDLYLKGWGFNPNKFKDSKDIIGLSGWLMADCHMCNNKNSILINKSNGIFHCESCKHIGNLHYDIKTYVNKPYDIKDHQKWFLEFDEIQENKDKKEEVIKLLKLSDIYSLEKSNFIFGKSFFTSKNKSDWIDSLIYLSKNEQGEIIDFISIAASEKVLSLISDNTKKILIPEKWNIHGYRKPVGLINPNLKDDNMVAITSSIIDYLTLKQFGIKSILSLPDELATNDSDKWLFLPEMSYNIKNLKRVITVFPDSVEGNGVGNEIARRIGYQKCYRIDWTQVNIQGQKQLSAWITMSILGNEHVEIMLSYARPYPSGSSQELIDVFSEVDFNIRNGIPRGLDLGLPTLDEYYSVKQGQSTMILGIPNHGKSTLVNNIIFKLSSRHGWRVGVFSPEYRSSSRWFTETVERTMGQISNASNELNESDYKSACRFVQDHYFYIDTTKNDQYISSNLDSILSETEILIQKYGIKALVIDPFNDLDNSRPVNITEKDFLQTQLTKLARFCERHAVHVFIIVHPNKMEKDKNGYYPVPNVYQADNGAMWFNKMDNIMCPHRHIAKEDEDIYDIHIQKIRFREIGKVGLVHLSYDPQSLRLVDNVNYNKRNTSLKNNVYQSSESYFIDERIALDTEYMLYYSNGKKLNMAEWMLKNNVSSDLIAIKGWIQNQKKLNQSDI